MLAVDDSQGLGSLSPLHGKRALVWGLGRHGGGVAVTRYLVRQGAVVTVVDSASIRDLQVSIDALEDTCPQINLGTEASPAAFDTADFDLLVVNPAIPVSHPELARWVAASSVEITSELGLIARETAGHRVVAVTGSNGKSTVTLWTANLLRRLLPDEQIPIGGNFELGLTDSHHSNLLDLAPLKFRPVGEPATFVLEVSSFQLAHLRDEPFAPTVAAITNVTPNHLDWHGSFAEYESAKRSLLAKSHIAIDGSKAIEPQRSPFHARVDRLNAALVKQIVEALSLDVTDEDLLATKPRIPHRRSVVELDAPFTAIDDSAATTPESVGVLLDEYGHSTSSQLVVIAGGRNKGFVLDTFAKRLAGRCFAVATIGETATGLAAEIAKHGGRANSHGSLRTAVRWAIRAVPEGGTIALSPGMASTDQFVDYRDRGHQFRQILRDELG